MNITFILYVIHECVCVCVCTQHACLYKCIKTMAHAYRWQNFSISKSLIQMISVMLTVGWNYTINTVVWEMWCVLWKLDSGHLIHCYYIPLLPGTVEIWLLAVDGENLSSCVNSFPRIGMYVQFVSGIKLYPKCEWNAIVSLIYINERISVLFD